MTAALAWHVSRWFNTAAPITLESLPGRVVAVHTFQMLCPGYDDLALGAVIGGLLERPARA
jgi:hypothetical protein